MTLVEQFKGVFADMASEVRRLPERLDRWTMKQHAPLDLAGDGSGPAVCPRCKAAWPCEQFVRLGARSKASATS